MTRRTRLEDGPRPIPAAPEPPSKKETILTLQTAGATFLWHLSTGDCDGDTWDEAVVAAKTEEEARRIHPDRSAPAHWYDNANWAVSWAFPHELIVEMVGIATANVKAGTVVCASYVSG